MSVEKRGEAIRVHGGQRLKARELVVPGDVSSAAFWIALAAGTPGGEIEIEGVGLNPTRTAMLEIVRRAGARVEIQIDDEDAAASRSGESASLYGSPAQLRD